MRLGIFGGSFNPPHVGHLRVALEAMEALALTRVDLVPVAAPAHKAHSGILPYGLRQQVLAAAVARVPGLTVSELEAVLAEPSYTYRTLAAYGSILPDAQLFFILGVGDLLDLPKWHRGNELPDLANLAVVARAGQGVAEVGEFVARFWPKARLLPPGQFGENTSGCEAAWMFPSGRKLYCVPLLRLEISATLVRQRYLTGKSIAYLVPREVEELLASRRQEVEAVWRCLE